VKFDVGGINFKGELTVSPEFNFEFKPEGISGGGGQPDDPDGIGEPGEPSDPIPPEDENQPAIVGVLVYSNLTEDNNASSILFRSGPNIYRPQVGISVSLRLRRKTASDGRLT